MLSSSWLLLFIVLLVLVLLQIVSAKQMQILYWSITLLLQPPIAATRVFTYYFGITIIYCCCSAVAPYVPHLQQTVTFRALLLHLLRKMNLVEFHHAFNRPNLVWHSYCIRVLEGMALWSVVVTRKVDVGVGEMWWCLLVGVRSCKFEKKQSVEKSQTIALRSITCRWLKILILRFGFLLTFD